MISFDRLDDALERLANRIENMPKDYTYEGVKYAEKVFKERVFGFGSKDVTGNKLPTYTPYYAKKKKKSSSTWDLQDSLSLRSSIRPIAKGKNKNAVLQVVDDDQLIIMDSLEQRSGKTIFEISPKESKEIKDYVTREILRDIKKAIKESFK